MALQHPVVTVGEEDMDWILTKKKELEDLEQLKSKNKESKRANVKTTPISVRFLYNPQARSAYNFVPGVMGLIMMLICAMNTLAIWSYKKNS